MFPAAQRRYLLSLRRAAAIFPAAQRRYFLSLRRAAALSPISARRSRGVSRRAAAAAAKPRITELDRIPVRLSGGSGRCAEP